MERAISGTHPLDTRQDAAGASNHDPLARAQPRWFALAAVLLWIPISVSLVFAPDAAWPEYLGILLHLSIFMLVAKLHAPEWARAAGYGYLVLDVASGVLALNDAPESTALHLRLAGHIFAGIWISTAALRGPMIMKIVGVAQAVSLAGYTFISPFAPLTALAPASVLTVMWLGLLVWQNGNLRHPEQGIQRTGLPPQIWTP